MRELLTTLTRSRRSLLGARSAVIVMTFCWIFASPADGYSQYIRSWAVEVRGGRDAADRLAKEHGFTNMGEVGNLQDMYHFSLNSRGRSWGTGPASGKRNARSIHTFTSHGDQLRTMALQREANVGYVKQQEVLEMQKRSGYTPPTDPQWPAQWSLHNDGQTSGPAELDLNVEPVWMQGFIGRGVVVTVVDDGLEANHPDLQINFDVQASRDFIDHDSDPTPTGSDSHGTACAGIIGMARNGVCGVGVAPGTSLGGLRLDLGYTFDVSLAGILSYQDNYVDIYSNSWGPAETGFTVGGPGYLTLETFKRETQQGRNSKGSIYVWAAGNGGSYRDSCAADGYVNSIYTIAVGSADQDGRQAYYDEDCSAKMAVTFSHNSKTAPSPGSARNASQQLLTTSLHGQCSDSFYGTSASAPLLSGVIALALEANSDLTWRDVQYLIVYTSNSDILTVDDLATNGAGLKFSHHFGFGAIDAEAMVTRARHWINVPEQISQTFTHSTINTVPASDSATIEFTVDNSRWSYENIRYLEHVVLSVNLEIGDTGRRYTVDDFITYHDRIGNNTDKLIEWLTHRHPRRGDIQIQLISPQNTISTLLPYRDYDFVNDEGYEDWPFMSVHFWGENPSGTWTVRISYKSSSGYVRVSGVSLKMYGTWKTPDAVRDIPDRCHDSCARGCWDEGPTGCDVCTNLRLVTTLECVDECPPGFTEYQSYCLLEYPSSNNNNNSASTGDVETQSEGESRSGFSIPILLSLVVAAVIVIFLVVILFVVILFVCQHHRRTNQQTQFSRLKDHVTSV